MLDASAERRFGPFQVGDYREFQGRRLKIIGRTREALSFTTSPIAFLDYPAGAVALARRARRANDIHHRPARARRRRRGRPARDPPPPALQRRLRPGRVGQPGRAATGSRAPGSG